MNNHGYFSNFRLIALFLLVALCAAPALAQSFNINAGGFSNASVCANTASPPPACQVLTNGSPTNPTVITGGILQLNAANQNQHASAWFVTPQPLTTGFTTSFQFQITKANLCSGCGFPADGMALVIQNDPLGTGALGYDGNGQNMAYGNDDIFSAFGFGQAIQNSLAVELDTYDNPDYGDPDGNHIAVQSCTPNNASALADNTADHTRFCPDGSAAKLALQSLGTSISLADQSIHTITVNYTPPGSCNSNCNNFAVYLDSNLVLQTTLNIAQQLYLPNGSAYVGFTSATGASAENSNIISWSFSQLPLSPINVNQPLQPTTTNFNYTQTLSAAVDYSQSGLSGSAFQGVVMQGTVQAISDQVFADLVHNTPFQGSSCLRQDTGNQDYSCVITTDLCTTPLNSIPAGANCPNITGTNGFISVSNTFNLDPTQKPIIAPDYLMGKDTALSCYGNGMDNNTCKGLVSIFSSISGDAVQTNGKTDGFNSILVPIEYAVEPSTSASTTPALNNGWINRGVSLNLSSTEVVPQNNSGPPSPLPAITGINYSVSGANVPNPASGVLPGATGSVAIPGAVEGSTTVTFFATDNAGNTETIVTNSGNQVSSAPPSITIKVDLTPPTVNCTPNNLPNGWTASDVTYNCTASDSGSGLANSSQSNFAISTNVPPNTQTSNANIAAVQVFDVAGNVATAGPYGPYEVDKLAPSISTPQLLTSTPTLGQNDTATYTCNDAGGSGVVSCGPTGSGSFPAVQTITETTNLNTNSIGSHSFTVNSQDAVNNASSPATVNYVVSQASTTTSIVSNIPNPSNLGQSVTVTFSVVGSTNIVSPTGNVVVTASTGENCSAAVSSGVCSIIFNTTGTRTLTASYGGDSNFLGSSSSGVSQTVNGTGFAITPSSLNFGALPLNFPEEQVVFVNNSTSQTITFSGITITGGKKGDFLSNSYFCSSPLSPGASCYVFVTFTGTVLGNQSATLKFVDNAPSSPQLVALSADVVSPIITLSPASINFGSVKVGTPVIRNVTLTSKVAASLPLTIGLSGSADFTQTSNCPSVLGPNGSCTIFVTFDPSAKAARTGTLTVTTFGNANKSVKLSGQGD